MLTALAVDDSVTALRRDLARSVREDRHRLSPYEFLDCFAELTLAAEAAAGRRPAHR